MEINSLEEAEELRSELRSLTKFRVWDLLGKDIEEQIEGRMETVMSPPTNMESLYTNEFLKGEIAGLRTGYGYARVILEQLEEYVKTAQGATDE